MVQHIPDLEILGICSRKGVQLAAQEDVLFGAVGVDQVDLSGVCLILTDGSDKLVHRGDTSPTRDHPDLLADALSVSHSTLGTAELEPVADLEICQTLAGQQAVGVAFDEQLQDPSVQVVRCWCV